MASLEPSQLSQNIWAYPRLNLGTLEVLAGQLHNELQGVGYSLLQSDIEQAVLLEVQYYAGWALLEVQRQSSTPMAVLLNKSVTLDAYEWAMIEPVVRSHCDLLQAKLVEGSRSLGGDGFGLQVSEAQQNYAMEREKLPKLAFIAPPYTVGKTG